MIAGLFIIGIFLPAWGLLRPAPQALAFENRAVASWPEQPSDWQEALEWPSRFEAWFADRALGRESALSIARTLLFEIANRAPTDLVLMGRDGFLFFKGENALAFDRLHLSPQGYDAAARETLRTEFARRTRWFADQGIPYYLVVVPEKFTVYDDAVPRRFGSGAPVKHLEQVEAELSGFDNFLSLRPALRRAKQRGLVYYRTDSHWNGRGAQVGYLALIEMLRQRWPLLQPRAHLVPPEGDDYYVQDLANMIGRPQLGVPERQDMAAFYAPGRDVPARATWMKDRSTPEYPRDWAEERWQSAQPDLDLKALFIRDSTSVPLRPTLAEHFRESVFLTTHRFDKQTVLREDPDLVVEIIVERGVLGLAMGYFHLQEVSD